MLLPPLYVLRKQQKLLNFNMHGFFMSNAFDVRGKKDTRDDFCELKLCSHFLVKCDGATGE